MPCCGAPQPDFDLVFGTFDGKGSDTFNSEKHRRARDWFAGRVSPTGDDPYCTRCEWDQTKVNIGGPEIRGYFHAADDAFFDLDRSSFNFRRPGRVEERGALPGRRRQVERRSLQRHRAGESSPVRSSGG
jgi:hypothetical protein